MIQWQFFPKNKTIPKHLLDVVQVFQVKSNEIDSTKHHLSSNEVLAKITPNLQALGYVVETGKAKSQKIFVPVLYGKNGRLEKFFDADGLNSDNKTVIEVEAGRGVTNYQFLKDLFQACMMSDIEYLIISIRNIYRKSSDFDKVVTFIETLYSSDRMQLPLSGILIIGY